jgi:trk system potassium uptake protein TrkA
MYAIIIGGGKIGYGIAKWLLDSGVEIAVIEQNSDKCIPINQLHGDIAVTGDAVNTILLEKTGIERADMLISTLSSDNDNLLICQLAKHKYAVSNVLALVNNPNNRNLFSVLGIDHSIDFAEGIVNRFQEDIGKLLVEEV